MRVFCVPPPAINSPLRMKASAWTRLEAFVLIYFNRIPSHTPWGVDRLVCAYSQCTVHNATTEELAAMHGWRGIYVMRVKMSKLWLRVRPYIMFFFEMFRVQTNNGPTVLHFSFGLGNVISFGGNPWKLSIVKILEVDGYMTSHYCKLWSSPPHHSGTDTRASVFRI